MFLRIDYIKNGAFAGCTSLKSIIIPRTVKEVGHGMFFGCVGLESITCLNPIPPSVGSYQHYIHEGLVELVGDSAVCLFVPFGTIQAYKSTHGWRKFKCIKETGQQEVKVSGETRQQAVIVSEERKKPEEAQTAARKEQEELRKWQETEQRNAKISGYFTDSRDGRKYRTVVIGGKTWMAENMNYQPPKGWAYKNSWYYNNDTSAGAFGGRLYDWPTATSVCPSGWKLPTDDLRGWGALLAETGGDAKAGKALKTVAFWRDGGNGEDTYGFSALPSGIRAGDGSFAGISTGGFWWTATGGSGKAKARAMSNKGPGVVSVEADINNGLSVRCIQK